MAAIKSLLNPLIETAEQDNSMDSNENSSAIESDAGLMSDPMEDNRTKPNRKKQKISKDAAVFKAAAIRGVCRYPPHEEQDDLLATKHELFQVYPIGEIGSYPRHIPYNSEKKLFLEKTGREYFEVFQYQFKVPADTTTYTMIWDYNIGLVRTTPLFKCGQYSKTTPAKMLSRNEGLKEICHSITGGALVAQGYWIPYDAAKAIAATFCWDIRYALTPVFGTDFPQLCIKPGSEDFGNMQIDAEITRQCAEQARLYRDMELQGVSSASPLVRVPQTPTTPKFKRQFKKLMPKPLKTSGFASDASSAASPEDRYVLSSPSPQLGSSHAWSAVNSPRSPSPKIKFRNPWSPATSTRSESPRGSRSKRRAADIPRSYAPLDTMPPPYKPLFPGVHTPPAAHRTPSPEDEPTTPASSTPRPLRRHMHLDEDYDAGSDDSDAPSAPANQGPVTRKKSSKGLSEYNAAMILVQMRQMGGAPEAGSKRLKRHVSL